VNEVERGICEKRSGKVCAVFYVLLATVIYLSNSYFLNASVKYMVSMAVVLWAAADFLVRPRVEDAKVCLKFFVLFYAPYFVFWVWSLGRWIFQLREIKYIMQGSQNTFYMFAVIGFVASSYYMFGKDSIEYNFYGMVMGNLVSFINRARGVSVSQLVNEYIRLVLSFGDETGSAIGRWELHDMVYGWGAMIMIFMIYVITRKGIKQKAKYVIFALISAFFFFGELKRIGAAGLMLAIVVFPIFYFIPERHKKKCAIIFCALSLMGVFVYLYAISTGAFYEFADKYGIDLMSRDWIYSTYEPFYYMSPFFLGQGVKFVKAYGQLHPPIFDVLHNVFLENYIEEGFIMCFLWVTYELYFRLKWIAKRYSWNATTFLFAIDIYVFITYLTDNSFYYTYSLNVTYRLVAMVFCLSYAQRAAREKEKIALK
jgi:toxin CptA